MNIWENEEKPLASNKNKIKPCKKCGYCPYGAMVEAYPFSRDKKSCPIFGHDCPMFYNAENIDIRRIKELEVKDGN